MTDKDNVLTEIERALYRHRRDFGASIDTTIDCIRRYTPMDADCLSQMDKLKDRMQSIVYQLDYLIDNNKKRKG
jgi:predicted RND superfamily exporter protein